MSETKSKMNQRRCPVCTNGVIETHGYAMDRRPQYRCGKCGAVHTWGHQGEAWDTRPRFSVRAGCTCSTCSSARKQESLDTALQ